MTMQVQPIPPTGGVVAREIPFHVFHDVALFDDEGKARFFENPWAHPDGTPKLRPEESNLSGGGSCVPQGQKKFVRWVSLQVDGGMHPTNNDLFEVEFVLAQTRFPRILVKTGHSVAAPVNFKIPLLSAEEKIIYAPEAPGALELVALEHFYVNVYAPKGYEKNYARLSLHGPLLAALPQS